jgi:4-amino-4-deoxy-L-arabinose transferase-like glycosyltransferase
VKGSAATERQRQTNRSDAAFGFALFFAALVPRLFIALRWAGEPVWDGHYYDFGARRIAAGFGYSDDRWADGIVQWHPWCHYPVGYSAVLGALYRVLGSDLRVTAVFDAGVSAGVCVMTWLLAKTALSPMRARVAGVIAALHPGLVLYAALVMTEPLSALLTLTAFWIATRETEPKHMRGFVIGALVLGLGALVRPQALLCAPFFGLIGLPPWLARKKSFARPAAAILACALALAPVLPWTVRNCARMDGCALVSTNAGWNLAIGSFPRATGRFETLHASDGCREVTGQVQQDRCWFAYGLDQIRTHPWHYLALVPAKLSFTFDHESFAVEYLREARPAAWPEGRRIAWRAVTSTAHRLLVCVAALSGVAFVFRRRAARATRAAMFAQGAALVVVLALAWVAAGTSTPTFYPLVIAACVIPWLPLAGRPPLPSALVLVIALIATTAITHAVFFGEDRYHIVVTPALCILAAAALRKPGAVAT